MTVHLSIPAKPKTAACGDPGAKKFTFWRWKADCALCKATTAAFSYEKAQQADTTFRADIPVRYSKLIAFARSNGINEEALVEFERDKRVACPPACHSCGHDLSDPIALMDVNAFRVVFACPGCSEPKMRERWEREGRR